MALFKSPEGYTEQERAMVREKIFNREFGQLRDQWYEKLISSGMPADQVYDRSGRRGLPHYSAEQEYLYTLYGRWLHKAPLTRFEVGKGTAARNREVWSLFAEGQTVREIAAQLALGHEIVHRIIVKLRNRCREDANLGLLDAEQDTRSEINAWIRLKAIKDMHARLLRSGRLESSPAARVVQLAV